jgi:hypothetical protein
MNIFGSKISILLFRFYLTLQASKVFEEDSFEEKSFK